MTLDELLRITVEMGADELLIKGGSRPSVRLHGDVVTLDMPVLTDAEAEEISCAPLTEEQRSHLASLHEIDAAYDLPGVARFRTAAYRQRGAIRSITRVIPNRLPTLESLKLPAVCKYFAERPQGLLLISGPAGSGKSTSVAAIVDYINQHFPVHIVTVEDPIEFVFPTRAALIDQREVGRDAVSCEQALRTAPRQDTDVIVAGELCNAETTTLAMDAAEAGCLVIATMRASSAILALEGIIDMFPPAKQSVARLQLSDILVGVVSQSLIKNREGTNRIACYETLVGVPSVRSLIREGKSLQIHALIQAGQKQGMITHDQSLASLVKRREVLYEIAREQAHNLGEFDPLCGQSARL